MADGGQTPERDGYGISDARSGAIDKPARQQQAECIGCLKCRDDVAVLQFIPPDDAFQSRRENSKHLAVRIVQSGDEEQECAYAPAITTGMGGNASRRLRRNGISYALHGSSPPTLLYP